MFFKGLKFGMLLQIAIGPVCLMAFNASSTYGLLITAPFILAVTLVDAAFVAFSCTSVAAIINKAIVKRAIKIIGSAVLILFGAYIIITSFGIQLSPLIQSQNISAKNLFAQGVIITAANPLTIVFWSGVFAAQIAQNNWGKNQIVLFASGCVASTLLFLTLIAILGNMTKSFLPQEFIKILNIAVGIAVIIFGIRFLTKKESGISKPDISEIKY
ncbi:MAG: LysE family transporter [Eubacteriaceae bacterium]|nr:LysE family transporter [Eubacteriaceae bacterium]